MLRPSAGSYRQPASAPPARDTASAVTVFDLVAAGTGLRDAAARQAGFDPVTVATTADDHKAYYPGATPVHLRITGDRRTGRLLGAQLLGARDAEIAKRVDTYATAISYGATVDGIADLDLSYTPPLGSPWDAVQVATTAWRRVLRTSSTDVEVGITNLHRGHR
ncbi:hypothetical protein [Paractinoplanes ferrugineus]|uniref:hypothetical protein n=1 Tax=Paractinoplanes ferrugineus TaxID=113564 RepID=UPI0023B2568A